MTHATDVRTPDAIESAILAGFSRILGLDAAESLSASESLMDMGADSLALMKCIDFVADRYGVTLNITQVYQEFATLGDLIDHVKAAAARIQSERSQRPAAHDAHDAHAFAAAAPSAAAPASPVRANAAAYDSIQDLLRSQVALMDRQMQFLDRLGHARAEPRPDAVPVAPAAFADVAVAAPRPSAGDAPQDRYNVFASRARVSSGLTADQTDYLADFMARYSARYRRSKEMTQQSRRALADNRASAGFRPHTKEILFPILADRADGAHLWDVDGNRFVDITMGFGVHLFGHNPDFVRERIVAQTDAGFPIGPQSPLAGRVAELITELSGHDRVVFCNSGTEATMTAMRIARAHTGRRKVVIFRESYHGTFDGFLARPSHSGDGDPRSALPASAPVSAGIVPGSIEDTVVLEYGDDASLAAIERFASDIAAVLVEPVQSRRPWLQPGDFLKKLRGITREHGIVFVWDEVITGFRAAAGGAQSVFGIQADLATYGKIVGGGMPIGLVAGRAELLDVIDGGHWQYGDDSAPQTEQIFFAGTFTKHPLAMAAAVATLEKIKSLGAALYDTLDARTARLVDESNALFTEAGIAIKVERFGSLFRYVSKKNIDLFFSHLMFEGVYVWEGRNCFLSTAHTDDQVDFILDVTRKAAGQLKEIGFFDDHRASSDRAATTPVTAWEHRFSRIWNPLQAAALNIGGGIHWPAPHSEEEARKLCAAVTSVLHGCDAFAVRYDASRNIWSRTDQRGDIRVIDARLPDAEPPEHFVQRTIDREMAIPFRHDDTWQCRASIVRIENHGLLLVLVVNHAVCDGYSFSLIVDAIVSACKGAPITARSFPASFGAASQAEQRYRASARFEADGRYWDQQLAGRVPQSGTPASDAPVGHLKFDVDAAAVAKIAAGPSVTRFAAMLAAFHQALLDTPSLSSTGLIGVATANRGVLSQDRGIHQLANVLPLVLRQDEFHGPAAGEAVSRVLSELLTHGAFPLAADAARASLAPIVASINLEPSGYDLRALGLDACVIAGTRQCLEFPVEINIVPGPQTYCVSCDFVDEPSIRAGVASFASRFETLVTTWSQHVH
ncbi:aminotransferase class III-fold pyridoxal phosphate-dependent enzyme [Burkholderia sp. Bp9002]|nr:aminotransferase class III-fold pyridoxal phosphate-dependent enzyme [Burkholderia sp. Bp9002]